MAGNDEKLAKCGLTSNVSAVDSDRGEISVNWDAQIIIVPFTGWSYHSRLYFLYRTQ